MSEKPKTTKDLVEWLAGRSYTNYPDQDRAIRDAIITRIMAAQEMAVALERCRAQFAFYTANHIEAGKLEKAETNAGFSNLCLAVLQKWEKLNG